MKYYYLILSLSFISFFSDNVKATHISGGDITYTCIGQNKYELTLKLFRDCSGDNMLYTQDIDFTNSCSFPAFSIPLNLQDPSTGKNCLKTAAECGTEISQLCPPQLPYSTCKGGFLPGMQEYIYKGIVNFPGGCNNWKASFNLYARNTAENVANSLNTFFSVATTINSTANPCNDSPVFTSQPIPYVCLNQLVNYSYGVIETDRDSMTFSLVNALAAGASVTYNTGYSGAAPIPGISIDPVTGMLTFTPTVLGNFVVAIKVSEYRNGILVGTVMRDIQFVVQNCPNNIPDANAGQITNLTGNATQTDPYELELCEGEWFSFEAVYTDLDANDTLNLKSNIASALPGAVITASGTNPLSATISWTATQGSSGNNSFTVTVEDNACPVRGMQTFIYTVHVTESTMAGPERVITICGNQEAQIKASGGTSFYWLNMAGDTIVPGPEFSCNPCSNPVAKPPVTTSYVLVSDLNTTCSNRDTITVAVVPDFSYSISQNAGSFCMGDSIQFNITTDPAGSYSFSWSPPAFFNDASIANPIAKFSTSGSFNYYVEITSPDFCSKTDSINVTVAPYYLPEIIATADKTCLEDSTQLSVTFKSVIPTSCGLSHATCAVTTPITIGLGSSASNRAFMGSSSDGRTQILYHASEIKAAGFTGGRISELAFNISSKSSTQPYNNFTIKIGCTDIGSFALPHAFQTGLSTVYSAASVNTVTGWNNFVFSSAYEWDGYSNLIVEICFDNTSGTGTDNVRSSSTGFYSVLFRFSSSNSGSGCSLLAPSGTINPFNPKTNVRPNIRFGTCEGAVNPADYTYEWSPGSSLSDSSIQNPMALPPDPMHYTVKVTNIAGGCSDTSTVNIQFVTQYDAGITPAGPFCITDPAVTLTAPNKKGVWSGIGITSASLGTFDPGIAGPGSHEIIYTIHGNCGNADTAIIVVLENFDYAITQNTSSSCIGDSVRFKISVDSPGNYTFSWYPSTYLNDTSIADPIAVFTSPGTFTYYVNITNGGCLSTDTVTVEVAPANFPDIADITDTVCPGDSVQLYVAFTNLVPATCGVASVDCSGASTTGILGTGISFNNAGAYPAPYGNLFYGARHQILYRASELNTMGFYGGKITNMGFNVVNINNSTTSYNDFEIRMKCTQAAQLSSWETGMFTVYPAQNITVTNGWNVHNFSNAFEWDGVSNIVAEICFNNLSSTENVSTRYTATGFNSVLYSGADSSDICYSGTPLVDSNRPNTKLGYCLGAVNPADYSYQWFPGTLLSDSTIQDPTALVRGPVSYTVVVTNIAHGCTDTASVKIRIMDQKDATIAPAGPFFCNANNVVTLIAADTGGVWSGAGITNSVSGTFNPGIAGPGAHQVIYTIAENCGSADTVVIEVKSQKADFGYEEIPCKDQIHFINLSTDTSSNFWNFGDGTTSNVTNPLHAYQEYNRYAVALIIHPSSVCADTAIAVIPFEDDAAPDTLFIPNVFTPNGDGKNDYFEILGADNPCIGLRRLTIFNRWGKKVFEAEGGRDQLKWAGTSNEMIFDDGVYFYVLEGEGFKKSGSVTLLR